jgi:arylsulfatase A-like enzyme
VLSGHGYSTAVYSPMRWWKSYDKEMFEEVGVQRQVYPSDSAAPPPGPLRDEWQRSRVTRDLASLQSLKQDLAQTLGQGKHFAYAFLPQIGHIPYPEIPPIQGETDLRKRARGILRVEDAWLGEVLQVLRQYHQLEKTVIVVVGDHGIRTSEEDPAFRSGTIDEYSFHVPLLIYAPRALHQPTEIKELTSHIDVAPTVLDLLGIEKGREMEEGAPIWDPRLADRQTYFLAGTVFGADGYYSKGRYYMRNVMSDTVYDSPVQHFETSDMVPDNVPQHDEVALAIARITGLQEVAAAHSGQRRN